MDDFSPSSDWSSITRSICAKQLRRSELPHGLAAEFMDLDEFFSETGTSSSSARLSQNGRPTPCDGSRGGKQGHHPRAGRRLLSCFQLNGKMRSRSAKIRDGDYQRAHLDRNILDAMNKAYDHNVCLDRFISEQQVRMSVPDIVEVCGSDSDLNVGDCGSLSVDDAAFLATVLPLDRTDNAVSNTGRSSTSPSSDSRSGCGNHCSSPSLCPTCSSVNPRSTEEDTNSVKSDSLESAETFAASANSKKDRISKVSGTRDSVRRLSPLSNPSSDSPAAVDVSSESGIVADARTSGTSNTRSNSIETQSECASSSKRYKGGKVGRKRRRGYIYDPKPVLRKMPKRAVPSDKKDDQYWERRRRNNDAARRSRELRRRKELEIKSKLGAIEQENQTLRSAIDLLVRRNEYLGTVLKECNPRDDLVLSAITPTSGSSESASRLGKLSCSASVSIV